MDPHYSAALVAGWLQKSMHSNHNKKSRWNCAYPGESRELPRHLCQHVLQEVALLALLHLLLCDSVLRNKNELRIK
jgi:hypothetical protein